MMGTAALAAAARAEGLVRRYGSGPAAVTALGGVSIEIGSGTLTAVMGPSGSGKSTLLHCLAGLDRPDSGQVWIGGAASNSERVVFLADGRVAGALDDPAPEAVLNRMRALGEPRSVSTAVWQSKG